MTALLAAVADETERGILPPEPDPSVEADRIAREIGDRLLVAARQLDTLAGEVSYRAVRDRVATDGALNRIMALRAAVIRAEHGVRFARET